MYDEAAVITFFVHCYAYDEAAVIAFLVQPADFTVVIVFSK